MDSKIIIQKRIHILCNHFKPFIHFNHFYIIDTTLKFDLHFTHFLIFAVWFSSNLNIPINNIDFTALYPTFKNIPFHSLLSFIKL